MSARINCVIAWHVECSSRKICACPLKTKFFSVTHFDDFIPTVCTADVSSKWNYYRNSISAPDSICAHPECHTLFRWCFEQAILKRTSETGHTHLQKYAVDLSAWRYRIKCDVCVSGVLSNKKISLQRNIFKNFSSGRGSPFDVRNRPDIYIEMRAQLSDATGIFRLLQSN